MTTTPIHTRTFYRWINPKLSNDWYLGRSLSEVADFLFEAELADYDQDVEIIEWTWHAIKLLRGVNDHLIMRLGLSEGDRWTVTDDVEKRGWSEDQIYTFADLQAERLHEVLPEHRYMDFVWWKPTPPATRYRLIETPAGRDLVQVVVWEDIAAEITAERARQVQKLGYTPDKDDQQYQELQLQRAAAAMSMHSVALSAKRVRDHSKGNLYSVTAAQLNPWPMSGVLADEGCPRRALVKAGALIVAAIEQIDRNEARKAGS